MSVQDQKEPEGNERLSPLQRKFVTVSLYIVVMLVELITAAICMGIARLALGKEWLHGEKFFLLFAGFTFVRFARPYVPSEEPTVQRRLQNALIRAVALLVATGLINWLWS